MAATTTNFTQNISRENSPNFRVLHDLAQQFTGADNARIELLVREISTLSPDTEPSWGPFIDDYRQAFNALMVFDAAGIDVTNVVQSAFPDITVTFPQTPTNDAMDTARIRTLEYIMLGPSFAGDDEIMSMVRPVINHEYHDPDGNDINCIGRHFKFVARESDTGMHATNTTTEEAARNFRSCWPYLHLEHYGTAQRNDASANSMLIFTNSSFVPASLDYDDSDLYIEEVTDIVYKNIYYQGRGVELPHGLLFTAFELFVMVKHGILHDITDLIRSMSGAEMYYRIYD